MSLDQNQNNQQWCPKCGLTLIEKPLFTSFYYECPACDAKPEDAEDSPGNWRRAGDSLEITLPPGFKVDEVKVNPTIDPETLKRLRQVLRAMRAKLKGGNVPDPYPLPKTPKMERHRDPHGLYTRIRAAQDTFYGVSPWPSEVEPEYRARLPDASYTQQGYWFIARMPAIHVSEYLADHTLDSISIRKIEFERHTFQYWADKEKLVTIGAWKQVSKGGRG